MEVKNKYQYIQIGIDVSNTVRSTLGPKGMNKMVITKDGPILTNDGATIIRSIDFNNPIAELFKKLAENQEKYIGDGTTTTVLFTGQLLEKALDLLNKKVHPTTIISGFNIARIEAIKFLNSVKFEASEENIIKTCFGSKISPEMNSKLSELLAHTDVKNLKLYAIENSNQNNTEIINGIQFNGYTINDRMPQEVEGNIAILDLMANFDSAKVSLTTTEELNKYNENSKLKKKEIVDKLVALGVKCAIITDTNPMIESFFTDANIMTIVNHKRDMLDNISRATGAKIIGEPSLDFSSYIGAGKVIASEDNQNIKITNPNSTIKTLVIHGATKQTLDETMRAIDDVIKLLRLNKEVVVGAGAIEIELSLYLQEFAKKIMGKEQIVIKKFAECLETIPMILAENCGHDSMEVLTMLLNQHSGGNRTLGVDANKIISDALERNVIEPVSLKINAINSATEVANLILKLDDIYNGVNDAK